jgi:hypothetical protein
MARYQWQSGRQYVKHIIAFMLALSHIFGKIIGRHLVISNKGVLFVV